MLLRILTDDRARVGSRSDQERGDKITYLIPVASLLGRNECSRVQFSAIATLRHRRRVRIMKHEWTPAPTGTSAQRSAPMMMGLANISTGLGSLAIWTLQFQLAQPAVVVERPSECR